MHQVTEAQLLELFETLKRVEQAIPNNDGNKFSRAMREGMWRGLNIAVSSLGLNEQYDNYCKGSVDPLVGYFQRNKEKNDLWQ